MNDLASTRHLYAGAAGVAARTVNVGAAAPEAVPHQFGIELRIDQKGGRSNL